MYELPSDLQHSLRSYRGSVRLSREGVPTSHLDALHDLEDQPQPQPPISGSAAPNVVGYAPSIPRHQHDEQSVILHPTASSGNVRDNARRSPQPPLPPINNTTTTGPHVQQHPDVPSSVDLVPHSRTTGPQSPVDGGYDDPAAARLAKDTTPLKPDDFYELLGMRKPDAQTHLTPKDLDTPHGFYHHVRHREVWVARRYLFYDIFVSALLVVQLLLSAVFIVLGSVNSIHHITITVLGAVSTLTAGILALVKGQGLPTRLRMERDGLRAVLLQADELYWDAAANRDITYGDVKKVRDAYSKVVKDATRNHPDTWNSSVEKMPQLAVPPGTTRHVQK